MVVEDRTNKSKKMLIVGMTANHDSKNDPLCIANTIILIITSVKVKSGYPIAYQCADYLCICTMDKESVAAWLTKVGEEISTYLDCPS